jgi:epoxyqueuosine reductase
MEIDLVAQLEALGYKARLVPVVHLEELGQEFRTVYRQGLLDEELYQRYLTRFSFTFPEALPQAQSILVVATPQPQIRVTFTLDGRSLPLVAPPTYLFGEAVLQRLAITLSDLLAPHGYRIAPASLPLKLLAVHSGLAAYGKNNISYVEGLGSFHRLAAFFTDLPGRQDPWQELHMLAACRNCSACQRRCPTGAIARDRFQLHAERCLTFHNEKASEIAFPGWINPSWHNSLVGCMRCQLICPQDKEFWGWVEVGPSFTEEETCLLLQGVPFEQLPTSLAQKVAQADLVELLEVLPRNLSMFFGREQLAV